MIIRVCSIILIVCVLGSCAYHPRVSPVIKIPDFYDYKVHESNLDVVVDPYEQDSKMNYLFNADITQKGILALHLIIWNRGAYTIDLSSASTRLRNLEGREYFPMPEKQVADKVLPNTVARMLGFGAMGTALLFFTVPFAIGAGVDSEIAKRDIRKDYAEKELKPGVVRPKEVFHGFLFFDLGEGSEVFNQPYYCYVSHLREQETGKDLNLSIRIELQK